MLCVFLPLRMKPNTPTMKEELKMLSNTECPAL